MFSHKLVRPLVRMTRQLSATKASQLTHIDFDVGVKDEIGQLATTLCEAFQKHEEYEEKLKQHEHLAAIGHVAHQVAHDIRSPLAALDVATSETTELPEEKRILIRHAVSRIRDIANNLIEKGRSAREESTSPDPSLSFAGAQDRRRRGEEQELSIHLLPSLIDSLVTEKRMQYRSRMGIEIEAHLDAESYGLFAKIEPREFKRVLSNLVNNAVEALGDKGSVVIGLNTGLLRCARNDSIAITVTDTGKGIPSDLLPQLMQRGETHGKEGGSGLGLYHAKETMERWRGSVHIDSDVGKGTAVTLLLPKEEPPNWFVPRLELQPNSTVVILDDDISIHHIWQNRLDALKEKSLKIHHSSTPSEITRWFHSTNNKENIVYLFDYELIGQEKTGLDLIEELKIARQSILVTSRYEEPDILQRCQRLGVKLIPKPMAGFVPLLCKEGQGEVDLPHLTSPYKGEESVSQPDCILIDDDTDIHLVWKYQGKQAGKVVRFFATADDFFAVASQIHKTIPVYVDSNLGDNIKGEEISKSIHEMGFANIYLATGYDANHFGDLPWIKGIVGKGPPFQETVS